MHSLAPWFTTVVVFVGVGVVCGITVLVAVLRDGCRRVPDHRPDDRIRHDRGAA